MTHTTTQMNLDIVVSDISQMQKDRYCVIPLVRGTHSRQIARDRKENAGCQGLGEKKMRGCLTGTEFPFCKMKSSGDGEGAIVFNKINVLNAPEMYL